MSKFNLIPVAGGPNRVFVKRAKAEETVTESGLFIPAVYQRDSGNGVMEVVEKIKHEGTVIAVSVHDAQGNKPSLKVGDYVFFSEYAGMPHEHEGEPYLSMKESDIHAKLQTK
jgi:co-chaperonin GroES (HSP10)